jgi:hypothetical protein
MLLGLIVFYFSCSLQPHLAFANIQTLAAVAFHFGYFAQQKVCGCNRTHGRRQGNQQADRYKLRL